MEKNAKPVVMTYYTYSNRIGGPLTYINTLLDSELAEAYQLQTLFQEKAPGGLDLRLLRDMTKAIKKAKPDIVHVQGAQSEGFYGVLAARLAGCKSVVMTIHGFAFDDAGCRGVKKFLYQRLVEPFAIRHADRVYCVCDFAARRDIVLRNAGRGKRNCGYIHNCVPTLTPQVERQQMRAQLGIAEHEKVFCISGRISKEKGFDILENTLHLLRQRNVQGWKLLVIGDGDYRSVFEAAVREQIDQGQVIMVGQTDRVADYLAAADAYIFPSYHENLSIALLEACAAGLACIVSNVGGNPEIVTDGVNGIVIQEPNAADYADAVAALLEAPEQMKQYQEAAKRSVMEHFSKEQMIQKIRRVYDSCIK